MALLEVRDLVKQFPVTAVVLFQVGGDLVEDIIDLLYRDFTIATHDQ